MKRKFSVIFVCIVFYGRVCLAGAYSFKMPDSYYEGDASTDSECILRDLKTERKMDIDFPMSNEPPQCRLTWSEVNRVVREDMREFIVKQMPNHSNCLPDELINRNRTMDLILTISAIQEAEFFSESEKNFRLINFRNELQTDLKEIAVKCKASEEEFVSLFRKAFESNETLIAMESTYCMAKYVTEQGVLDLADVNLNPHNIRIENLNCTVVMADEICKDEKRIRDHITLRDEGAVACLMNVYKEKKVVELDFAALVLRDLEMPVEVKKLQRTVYQAKRAHLSESFIDCYKMDKEFDPDRLQKIIESANIVKYQSS